jgi:hypothetical protein
VFGGGPEFRVGDKLLSTENSDTRFIYLEPLPPVELSKNVKLDDVIEEDCPCDICYGPLDKRVILPCKHCFCSGCIDEWAQTCEKQGKEPHCPMCKQKFAKEFLLSGDFIYKGDTLVIQSIDSILRKIGMKSGKEIQSFSICNEWRVGQKDIFLEAVRKLAKKPDRAYIFLALTNCMFSQIIDMPPQLLINIVNNFGGDAYLDMPKLLHEALYQVYHNVYEYFC